MYRIQIEKQAVRQLKRIPQTDFRQIKSKILSLANNPRPVGCKKLKGRNAYRVRQGNYRIIYEIKDEILLVTVITVRHRKDVYHK